MEQALFSSGHFLCRRTNPVAASRRSEVGRRQIGPSILGLPKLEDPHQCWGRNLFALDPEDEGFAVIKPSGGEDRVALIEGDRVLIKTPKGRPSLYRYDFGHPSGSSEDLYSAEKDLARTMEKRLQAYVETGILSLRARRVGMPPALPDQSLAGVAHRPGP
jgi:hypothetical protein